MTRIRSWTTPYRRIICLLPFLLFHDLFYYPSTPFSLYPFFFRVAKVSVFTRLPNMIFEELSHFLRRTAKIQASFFSTNFLWENLFFNVCKCLFFNELSSFLKRGAKIGCLSFSPNFFYLFSHLFAETNFKELCFFVKRAAKISVEWLFPNVF